MNNDTAELIVSAVRGAAGVRRTADGISPSRLPDWTREQFDSPMMQWVADQTSGVRLAFRTSATWLEIDLTSTRMLYPNMPPHLCPARIALTLDGVPAGVAEAADGPYRLLAGTADVTDVAGARTTARFDLGVPPTTSPRRVEIWLPNNASVQIHDVRSDAAVQADRSDAGTRWLHYGSSISHCAEADTPLGVWPVDAAHRLGLDITNLGFGGNAHLDPFVARTIRDSDAELISVKLGINIVNADSFKRRTFIPALHGFLDTIREGKPTAPILLITPISCPMQEDTAGPIAFDPVVARLAPTRPAATIAPYTDGSMTLRDIRLIVRDIIAQRRNSDVNLHILDGPELFGPADVDDLPDGLHPNSAGYRRMAQRFAGHAAVRGWSTAAG